MDPDDVARFAAPGIVADFQVGPESGAAHYHDYPAGFIGQRVYTLILVARLRGAGTHVKLSSGSNADPISSFGTMPRALTRDGNAIDSVARAIELAPIAAAELRSGAPRRSCRSLPSVVARIGAGGLTGTQSADQRPG